jgi:hypothetical protein
MRDFPQPCAGRLRTPMREPCRSATLRQVLLTPLIARLGDSGHLNGRVSLVAAFHPFGTLA